MPEGLASFAVRPAERNRWVLSRRGPKNLLSPYKPHAFFSEMETGPDGSPERVSTILLTNRECPFKCVMCDLWRNTLDERAPVGAIPAQVQHALERLPPASSIKLYNSGSFFDPQAIPPEDYPAIAELVASFSRVIVESHPFYVGERALLFRSMLTGELEVALGLETAHPTAFSALNKHATLEQYRRSAAFLQEQGIAVRFFLLLDPPYLSESDSLEWALRSVDTAFEWGAQAVVMIPTRLGGAMNELAQQQLARVSSIPALERALEHALQARRPGQRAFADLWDLAQFSRCSSCFEIRRARLEAMNRLQRILPAHHCRNCAA